MGFSSRICSISLVLAFALLLSFTEARDHLVGGKPDAWKVPASQAESLNNWAEKNRFNIGDNLVWKYDSKQDSVLQVTREAYLSCNTSSPIAEHKEGETKVALSRAGLYYFISGSQPNCQKGEKLIVLVISPRTKRGGGGGGAGAGAPAAAPAFAPSPESGAEGAEAPAVAPASGSGNGAAGLKGCGVMVAVVGVLGGFLMM